MSRCLLDTNVLLRFLVQDNQQQYQQAHSWFTEGEKGIRKIIIVPLMIAETAFVLESFYQKKRSDIADALEVFLSQRWLEVEGRDVLLGLWDYYRKGFHFVDAYLLVTHKIYGYDLLTFDIQMVKKINNE